MKTSRIETTVLILSISGAILAALSLSLPWYSLEYTGYSDRVPDGSGSYSGTYLLYPNYLKFVPDENLVIPAYYLNDPYLDGFDGLMDEIQILVWLMLFATILFTATAFANRARMSLVFGAIATLLAISVVVLFAVLVDDMIMKDFLQESPGLPDGFIGSGTDDASTDWNWGPTFGWGSMVAASILVASALGLMVIREPECPLKAPVRNSSSDLEHSITPSKSANRLT